MTLETPRQRVARQIGLLAWAALFVLLAAWIGFAGNPSSERAPALFVALVPLALPVLALRRPTRALLLAGMLALFYFAHGVTLAWDATEDRGFALGEALLALVLVLAAGFASMRGKRRG